jgi:tetratricopeptide (TPR) repeat protein
MLTTNLLIRNNLATEALKSLNDLKIKPLIGNIGSVEYPGAIKFSLNNNLSQVRNTLIDKSEDWIFYIEPWETLLEGNELIKKIILGEPKAYRVNVILGDTITKQVRIWHKSLDLKFKNPVFEFIDVKAPCQPIYINSHEVDDTEFKLDLTKKWKEKNPVIPEPHYYLAFLLLRQKKWDEFINTANHFLFLNKTESMTVIITKYYLSMIFCHIKKDYQKAVYLILECLAKQPLLAEFWCLLADIYFSANDFLKAKEFYQNAILLGTHRILDDEYPIEISKYKEYPEKMMTACDSAVEKSKNYAIIRLNPSHLPQQ